MVETTALMPLCSALKDVIHHRLSYDSLCQTQERSMTCVVLTRHFHPPIIHLSLRIHRIHPCVSSLPDRLRDIYGLPNSLISQYCQQGMRALTLLNCSFISYRHEGALKPHLHASDQKRHDLIHLRRLSNFRQHERQWLSTEGGNVKQCNKDQFLCEHSSQYICRHMHVTQTIAMVTYIQVFLLQANLVV